MSGQSESEGKRAAAKAGSAASRSKETAPGRSRSKDNDGGLIVGIGASAGGLSAFKSFLSNMPPDSGMALVLIQHLSPDHKSMLTELLGRSTAMVVVEAEDGMPVEANRVFVIAPDSTLTVKDRRLRVERPAPPREHRRPIDTFFSSLAEDQGENAICIVLSGTGSDGTLGLKRIKENGGLTLAQAEFDHTAMIGMPHSATATGLVDHVLPVEEMPAKLRDYQRHLTEVSDHKDGDGTRNDAAEHLAAIVTMLRIKIGHDFSKYKEKTVIRRIQRRMQVLQTDTVPAYLARLREDPHQVELLFREMLIGVTQFFRDPNAFGALETLAIEKLLQRTSVSEDVRIWVPACATGEEAYSIAILLKEAMEKHGVAFRTQIFATDIDDNAVAFARWGRYRKTTGISAERLARWFTAEDDEVRPIREIREMCVFSMHSVVKDPPFSRLDLVSCRNLLIYMDAELQDRMLRMFHYALKPDGILFLGPSEGVGRLGALFASLDKKHHIFQRREADARFPNMPSTGVPLVLSPHHAVAPTVPAANDRIDRSARRALAKYSPVYIVIDGQENILRFSGGEVGSYLEPAAGAPSFKLFSNLRKTLRFAVRAALHTMSTTNAAAVQDNVAIRIDGRIRPVTVIAEPLSGGNGETSLFMIIFLEGHYGSEAPDAANESEPATAGMRAIEHELRTVRNQLQSSIDDLEIANEEMKSAAEEYQSVNEELQSSNEELETSKEEMQSINEELQTINAEMNAKNEALRRVNSDLKNLLDSTQIATMFLDSALRIKSFTPGMTEIFHLRESDRGRPATEIVTLLAYDDIAKDVAKVLRDLTVVEREVALKTADAAYILRIRPYRTIDDAVDGVVLTFVDISERRRADQHESLLLAELDHRVKNILTIVSSVVTQSLESSAIPAAFATAIEGRIAAISRAQNMLTQSGGGPASLRELLTAELAPYDRGGQSLSIAGADVGISPKAGLALAMVFHELASNAAKYGALSTEAGSLAVSWTVSRKSRPTLHFLWIETGGPPIAGLPSRRGFGSTLIERTLSREMDAIVTQEFRPSGFCCAIDIPLTSDIGHTQDLPR
jgi:two-component system, chemotaxis family, CheB/CheR fusion protein